MAAIGGLSADRIIATGSDESAGGNDTYRLHRDLEVRAQLHRDLDVRAQLHRDLDVRAQLHQTGFDHGLHRTTIAWMIVGWAVLSWRAPHRPVIHRC